MVSSMVDRFLVTVPTEEKVSRTGQPSLWFLIMILRWGVETSGGEIQDVRSSGIDFNDDFEVEYHREMFIL